MSMDRRNFLARLLAGATGVVLAATTDLDKLLWVPGEKTIFLPPQKDLGISMRFVKQWDISTDALPRLDVIYGLAPLRPELAVRVGNQFVTPEWMMRDMVRVLENNLKFHKHAFGLAMEGLHAS